MKILRDLLLLAGVPVAIILLCTASLWTPAIGIFADNAEANRARAQTDENRAEADLEEARALAGVLEKYTDVGTEAIRADMYTAHPWLFLVDAARFAGYLCAALAVLAILAFAVMFWRNSERALQALFGLLERAGFVK